MQRTRGTSLAKGPIALIGLLGIIYGLSALIVRAHGFALHFPSGHVHGPFWIHLKVNGWTALLFIAAGVALLFSAAAHITAKTMAMLVGIVMIVLAIIAFAQKHGALGIFAADHWTEAVWAAGGIVLLVLAMLPRVGGRAVGPAPVPARAGETGATPVSRQEADARQEPNVRQEPSARQEADARQGADVRQEPSAHQERVARRDSEVNGEPVGDDADTSSVSDRQSATRDEPLIRRGQRVPASDEE